METRSFAESCVEKINQNWKKFDWENPTVYADWLAQTYYYVCHATRVLARAASKCSLEQEPFHKSLLHGINEEKNHEILAENDIKQLGFDLSQFPERPETTSYYSTLYSLIDFEGPQSLVGFFIPLEGVGAVGGSVVYDRVVKAYGKKAATFAKVHSIADITHYQEGLDTLNSFQGKELKSIEKALGLSTELYVNLLNSISATAQSQIRKSA